MPGQEDLSGLPLSLVKAEDSKNPLLPQVVFYSDHALPLLRSNGSGLRVSERDGPLVGRGYACRRVPSFCLIQSSFLTALFSSHTAVE